MNHEYIHMHPPALGDLDADLLDPPWTVLDLVLVAVFFVGGLILAWYVAAKLGIV